MDRKIRSSNLGAIEGEDGMKKVAFETIKIDNMGRMRRV